MSTLDERVARLEGGYEHMATKADLYKVAVQLGLFLTAVVSAAVAFLKVTS